MCGRFVRRFEPVIYADLFGLASVPDLKSSYNVAPTQTVLTVRAPAEQREGVLMKWGLVPAWSKDGRPFINARVDTAAEGRRSARHLRNATAWLPPTATTSGRRLPRKGTMPLPLGQRRAVCFRQPLGALAGYRRVRDRALSRNRAILAITSSRHARAKVRPSSSPRNWSRRAACGPGCRAN